MTDSYDQSKSMLLKDEVDFFWILVFFAKKTNIFPKLHPELSQRVLLNWNDSRCKGHLFSMENPKINIGCWLLTGSTWQQKSCPMCFFRKNQKKKCIFIHVKMWYRCWPVDPMLTKVAPSIFSCKIDVFRTVNDWNRTKTHSCSSCWKLKKRGPKQVVTRGSRFFPAKIELNLDLFVGISDGNTSKILPENA